MTTIHNGQSLLAEPMLYAEVIETEERSNNETEKLRKPSSVKFLEPELDIKQNLNPDELDTLTAPESEPSKSSVILRREPIAQWSVTVSQRRNGVRRCGRLSEY